MPGRPIKRDPDPKIKKSVDCDSNQAGLDTAPQGLRMYLQREGSSEEVNTWVALPLPSLNPYWSLGRIRRQWVALSGSLTGLGNPSLSQECSFFPPSYCLQVPRPCSLLVAFRMTGGQNKVWDLR